VDAGHFFGRKRLRFVVALLLTFLAIPALAAERVAFVVWLSSVPTLCAYDLDAVAERTGAGEVEPWGEPLGCENVLIGEDGHATAVSPPEGFGVTHSRTDKPRYGCPEVLYFTEKGDAIHCVIQVPKRIAALAKPAADTARQSLGCVNASAEPDGLFRKYFPRAVVVHVIK
jgi:hypothetical protein